MTRGTHKLLVVSVSVLALCLTTGVSSGNGIGLRLESGTVLPYEALDEVGNGFGVHLTYELEMFQLSLGGGFIFPGSRADSALVSGQMMGQWHPFREAAWAQRSSLSPYASVGFGIVNLTEEEDASDAAKEVEVVRWIHESDQLVGLLGLGVTYGVEGDLYISAEARTVNHTHLALLLGAGTSF
jgi:hypothetical protein